MIADITDLWAGPRQQLAFSATGRRIRSLSRGDVFASAQPVTGGKLPLWHSTGMARPLQARGPPAQMERAWDAGQAERYRRGETGQQPAYTDNLFHGADRPHLEP